MPRELKKGVLERIRQLQRLRHVVALSDMQLQSLASASGSLLLCSIKPILFPGNALEDSPTSAYVDLCNMAAVIQQSELVLAFRLQSLRLVP